MEVAPTASNTSARYANDGSPFSPDRASHLAGGIMTDRNIRDAEIVRAIDTELLRRRQQFEGQPAVWSILCEAAHVATLNKGARIAFIEHVAADRGADIALRLLLKAEAIRESVVRSLQAAEGLDEEEEEPVERLAVLH
ncbi:hypothetical protein MAFF301069_14940 [Ralstonia pseudosolanacearum]|nr:hypothetical protein MAFF301069_14940 [Ralstonia pseudosolanacearum]